MGWTPPEKEVHKRNPDELGESGMFWTPPEREVRERSLRPCASLP
ncbi:MAG: hypothetical protein ACETWM_21730 [Candidatus Lokiarchaeia archaeon]